MMIVVAKALVVPDSIVTSQSEFEVCRKKQSGMLGSPKMLKKKNLLLYCHISLNCCRVCFIDSTIVTSLKKVFDRISMISIYCIY